MANKEKENVPILTERTMPSAGYRENVVYTADPRVAAFIAQELWEERKRVRAERSSEAFEPTVYVEPDQWTHRTGREIVDDITVVQNLMNRGIIK